MSYVMECGDRFEVSCAEKDDGRLLLYLIFDKQTGEEYLRTVQVPGGRGGASESMVHLGMGEELCHELIRYFKSIPGL